MRIFLDTNIILDVLLNRPGLVAESEEVILQSEVRGHAMFIAWHGLATAYYLLKRGRTESEALAEIDKLLAWASVADVSDADARAARAMGFGDFEDALQAASAEACRDDVIVTRNPGDFSKSKISAMSPKQFLQRHPRS